MNRYKLLAPIRSSPSHGVMSFIFERGYESFTALNNYDARSIAPRKEKRVSPFGGSLGEVILRHAPSQRAQQVRCHCSDLGRHVRNFDRRIPVLAVEGDH